MASEKHGEGTPGPVLTPDYIRQINEMTVKITRLQRDREGLLLALRKIVGDPSGVGRIHYIARKAIEAAESD
jgi:hypothetical protein